MMTVAELLMDDRTKVGHNTWYASWKPSLTVYNLARGYGYLPSVGKPASISQCAWSSNFTTKMLELPFVIIFHLLHNQTTSTGAGLLVITRTWKSGYD